MKRQPHKWAACWERCALGTNRVLCAQHAEAEGGRTLSSLMPSETFSRARIREKVHSSAMGTRPSGSRDTVSSRNLSRGRLLSLK